MDDKSDRTMRMDGIRNREEFHRTIRRERLFSDRTGQEFSLVLFSLIPQASGIDAFLNRIGSRMRMSDSAGWFDRKRLGVILPGTGAEGAVKFAEAAVKGDPSAAACTGYRVTGYPAQAGAGSGRYSPINGELQTVLVRRLPVWKRIMDIVGAVFALILTAPVTAVTAIYIMAVSPGPVLFRQERVGYGGRLFIFYKFRTMRVNNDVTTHREHLRELINSDTPMRKLDTVKDPRIIPGGTVIRKLSIDELPQFINVLKGDMSLIGPRPCIPYEAEEYLRWHTHRFDTYPGLSGLWQVSGKNRLSFKEMVRLDIAYANRMSILQDIGIILRTIPTLIGIALEKPSNRRTKRVVGET